ncbi:MAG: hypothetical protein U9R00_02355 [Patescibacteria group bacterium]|nr:hypothetical protein [Patescibacteria group bacterium]
MKNKTKNTIALIFSLVVMFSVVNTSFAASNPVMTTNAASNVTSTSATLSGFYSENGSTMTQIYFDYGTSPLLGTLSATASIEGTSGSYNITVNGLNPETTYYFQAVGTNGVGTTWGNPMVSFITTSVNISKPVASTSAATNITTNSATLNGFVSSDTTSAYFKYGTSANSLIYSTPNTSSTGSFSSGIINLNSNTTYYFRTVASNNNGTTYGSPIVSFTTNEGGSNPTSNCSIDSLTASSTTIDAGDSVTISWGTSNCTSVILSKSGYNVSSGHSGSYLDYPTATTTYTLTADTLTQSLTVSVNSNNNGGGGNYYYNYCAIDYFNVDKTSITVGQPVTVSWSTRYCNSVNLSNVGSVANSGTYVFYPYSTTTYTLNTSGTYGSDYRTLSVNVNSNNNNNNNNNNYNNNKPLALSTSVSSVTSSSAIIHGTVYTKGTNPTYTYFEYGRTSSLGKVTSKYSIQDPVTSKFMKKITGLTPSTTYYFRLVAENRNGISKGDILYFTTAEYKSKINNPVITNFTKKIDDDSKDENDEVNKNNLGASAASSGNFLPGTAVGWLLLIILALVVTLIIRSIPRKEYNQNK